MIYIGVKHQLLSRSPICSPFNASAYAVLKSKYTTNFHVSQYTYV